jgi:hypothetical protein
MLNRMGIVEELKTFDVNTVSNPSSTLSKLQKLTSNPSFKIDIIRKSSCTAAGLCQWVLGHQESLINRKNP